MYSIKSVSSTACLLMIMALGLHSAPAAAEGQFLRSAFELEDPSGYCLDIPGFGPRMRKDAPITTHTCKYSRPGFSVDEIFEFTATEQLRLPEYDLCLSAEPASAADVFTKSCENSAQQHWRISDAGQVTPKSDNSLCITLAATKEYVNTSPGNLVPNSSRSISLQKCGSTAPRYQSWKWSNPSEQPTPTANMLRAGLPPSIASKIKEMGAVVKPPETAALFKDQKRMFTENDVTVSEKIQYGENDSHQLQIYTGNNRNNPRDAAPVLMLVHGGGFARGGLDGMKLPAIHFAGLGYVVVNITYPLLPEAKWPNGGQSVAAAVSWTKKNAKDLKANPERIFVFGTSAGGANVAEFVFKTSIVEGDSPTIAGAILTSPTGLTLNTGNPSKSALAYYGEDVTTWNEKQTLGNIERTSIPVLITTAEFDPRGFHTATAALLSELLKADGVSPRFAQLRGHNHTSYIAGMGTSDNQLAEEILDFMETAE